MDDKSDHAAQCDKSREWNKVIDSIIEINSFENKCVIIKGLFQSERLKQHMATIVINKSLSNCAIY